MLCFKPDLFRCGCTWLDQSVDLLLPPNNNLLFYYISQTFHNTRLHDKLQSEFLTQGIP
jgi:hypothetical protein